MKMPSTPQITYWLFSRTLPLIPIGIAAFFCIIMLGGCDGATDVQETSTQPVELTVVEDEEELVPLNVVHDEIPSDEPSSQDQANDTVHEDAASDDDNGSTSDGGNVSAPNNENGSIAYAYTAWSEDAAPEYYRIDGTAKIDAIPEPGTATYSPLDALGRSGQAAACITFNMMEEGRARKRESLSSISPSGWGDNREVDIPLANGKTYHGQFWNRSHLIAKSLGGEDVEVNLVTGTRMQNVGSNGKNAGGMGYCENLARMWLEDNTDGWLAYVATPVYEGDELVCRSVIVDMRSSDGTLDVRVEVYNAAKGYIIDYSSGAFAPDES